MPFDVRLRGSDAEAEHVLLDELEILALAWRRSDLRGTLVSTNCGVCHNDRGPLARLGLVLLHDASGDPDSPEPALATAAGARGRYVSPGVSPDSSRIVAAGSPEHSALLHRMQSRRPASQMPPLGTVIADEHAIELVRQWIESLTPPLP